MDNEKPNNVALTDQPKSPPEVVMKGFELSYDSIKHLTTISTGSILLIIGFLEKLFPKPEWKFLVGIALLTFALTILANLALCRLISFNFEYLFERNLVEFGKKNAIKFMAYTILGPLFFYIGIISLITFAFKNLF
jgi:hypothetical protein